MRILFVSQRFVLPMDTGGKIRTGKTLEQLSKRHDVTLVSNFEPAKDTRWVDGVQALCHSFVPVPWTEVERHTIRFYVRLAFQMLSVLPVTVLNTYSRSLREEVERLCSEGAYDVAVCDFVQCGKLFARVTSVPVVLFQHNVEAEIVRRHVEQSDNMISRAFWWLQWRKMFSYERHHCRQLAHVVAVSDHDRQKFAELYGVTHCTAIPTGVDTTYYRPDSGRMIHDHSVVFCGSMDWLPNEDGVVWFAQTVLPLIRREIPDVQFVIVGRRPSPSARKLLSDVEGLELTGWVDDTRPYVSSGAVFVVPLRIGGGTRMKIYEAMALARPVVSTSVGAEGLPVTSGVNCFIEDEPHAFAARVVALLTDVTERERVGAVAREFIVNNFSWERAADEFATICERTHRNSIGASLSSKNVA